MFPPPWGIFPPRHMMIRPPCTDHRRNRNAQPPKIWQRLFRKGRSRDLPGQKGNRHAAARS